MMEYTIHDHLMIIRVDRGEELIASLKQAIADANIGLGVISGIGAADRITIGVYNVAEQKYYKSTFTGEYELTAITGNVTTMAGEHYLHVHLTFGDEAGHAYGGHLNEAWISGTAEVFIQIAAGTIDRAFDDRVGLNTLVFPQNTK